ncbi:MAG: cytochrome oxidase Cu insertion factor (SCO1/SenC/PrrC family) [Flavobacterium sp.]|jgi:cytochrome oxidase Cu insertion factor (SCO1/SenC/PrrC family)
MISEAEVKKNKRSLVLMFSIGLVPVVIAYVIFIYFPQYLPTVTTNQGQLITPPVSAEAFKLIDNGDKWALIVPLGSDCDEVCVKRFYNARQVNVALGKEAQRVKRIMITNPYSDKGLIASLSRDYPDMDKVEVDLELTKTAFEKIISNPFTGNYIFLMDPNGNIMMLYTLDQGGAPMLKDIKFLLKISNIG